MKEIKNKINPYLIVIVILALVVVGFAYDKWGDKIRPASVENTENQNPDEGTLSFEGDISVGNENAPVTIVEYYSYFCGYCGLFHQETYPKILEDYISNGKVKYVFRPFPPFELGLAVLCAQEQDKFLEYHGILFEEAANIQEVNDLKTLAKDNGLDENKFNECFDSQKYLSRAQGWYQQGSDDFEKVGVPEDQRGTPAFFINGELVVGAQPYEVFTEIIESKLSE